MAQHASRNTHRATRNKFTTHFSYLLHYTEARIPTPFACPTYTCGLRDVRSALRHACAAIDVHADTVHPPRQGARLAQPARRQPARGSPRFAHHQHHRHDIAYAHPLKPLGCCCSAALRARTCKRSRMHETPDVLHDLERTRSVATSPTTHEQHCMNATRPRTLCLLHSNPSHHPHGNAGLPVPCPPAA